MADASSGQTATPLPAARPSNLSTVGYLPAMAATASSSVSVAVARAVGMPLRMRNSLANSLLASNWADSFGGPQQGMPFCCAEIGESLAFDEVAFLASHAEVDGVGFHPGDERFEAVGSDGFGDLENRVAAGEAEQFGFPGRFRQGPHQRVFAPAFANDQYSHPRRFSRNPAKDSIPIPPNYIHHNKGTEKL